VISDAGIAGLDVSVYILLVVAIFVGFSKMENLPLDSIQKLTVNEVLFEHAGVGVYHALGVFGSTLFSIAIDLVKDGVQIFGDGVGDEPVDLLSLFLRGGVKGGGHGFLLGGEKLFDHFGWVNI
jgi:hypothetical protein